MRDSQVLADWKGRTHGQSTKSAVRPVIVDSGTPCLQAEVTGEAGRVRHRRVGEAVLRQRLESNHELVEIAQRHLRVISAFLAPLAHVSYLVDGEGVVLLVQGNDHDAMQDLGLLPGSVCSEHAMGRNGDGTTLVTDRPVSVTMSEHFIRRFHEFTCAAAPIHGLNGAVIATIDVCTTRETMTAERLASVAQLASVIEQELSSVRQRHRLIRRSQNRFAPTAEALRNPGSRLARICRSARMALYEAEGADPFRRTWVSDSIESLSGFPAGRFPEDSKHWAFRLHPDDRGRVFAAFATLVDRGSLRCEYRWQCADGTFRWFLDQAVLKDDANGQAPIILGTWQDITEWRDSHAPPHQQMNTIRMLSRHIEAVREEEQTRLAREIHDEMGGLMTGLKLDLAQMRNLVGKADSRSTTTSLTSKLDSMDAILDQTITVVQRIAADLRPHVLDDLGLVAAIEWQAHVLKSRTGIRCDVIIETDDPRVDSEGATALFRICQEALTNVARHAHATRVTVRLSETLDQVLLEIEDNGEGIPTKKLTDRMSIGLLGMRERADLLEGEVHIAGTPGKGTIVTVRIPIAHRQRDERCQTI